MMAKKRKAIISPQRKPETDGHMPQLTPQLDEGHWTEFRMTCKVLVGALHADVRSSLN